AERSRVALVSILRLVLSCSNVSCMPLSFAPPHPKQRFVAFGSSLMVSPKELPASPITYALSDSNQSHAATLGSPGATLSLAHFHPEQIRNRRDAAGDLLLVKTREGKAQRIRKGCLRVEIAPWREQNAAFLYVNQQFAGIKARR